MSEHSSTQVSAAPSPGGLDDTAAADVEPASSGVESLRANLAAVQERLEAAAQRAGREASEIRLLPVSKTVPEERLRDAYTAGVRQMGENKVQEARRKSENLADLGISWVLIGHLQTNKAKDAALLADELQSLSSLSLARSLERRLQAAGRGLDVYVQVNSSGEASKSGLEPGEVAGFLAELQAFSSLRVRGLMTIAAHSQDQQRVRECFRLVRELRDAGLQAGTVGDGQLSMGMSSDLDLAVEEGSTCVRVGQAVFGARQYPDAPR